MFFGWYSLKNASEKPLRLSRVRSEIVLRALLGEIGVQHHRTVNNIVGKGSLCARVGEFVFTGFRQWLNNYHHR